MNHDARPVAPADTDPHSAYEAESRRWLAEVYQGDRMRQLSVRSIVTGMIIGGVMSVSNLYVGLKTGWGLGVTITSCIVAYAVFKVLEGIFPSIRNDPFTILENYTMSSATSAASYISSSGLSYAIPAMYMLNLSPDHDPRLPAWQLMAWLGAVSCLGVFIAIPMKRQMINIEKLPFPDGIATAETLRSLHTTGTAAMAKAKRLFAAVGIGALIGLWQKLAELGEVVTNRLHLPDLGAWLASHALDDAYPLLPTDGARTALKRNALGWDGSTIMLAAGAVMGLRAGLSLLVGAVVFYYVIGEQLVAKGITGEGYGGKGITKWVLWPATAMLVSSGLTSFALNWRTILRAFKGLTQSLRGGPKAVDPLAHVEVPMSWFVVGTVVCSIACIELAHSMFGIARWMGLIAVVLAYFLSLVACRATGETNITPIGAMGKITQLTYGLIDRGNMTTNLMTANITAGAASHSADLLCDLKSGHLLGGKPRAQTISQLFGVLAGVLICVPVFTIIVDPEKLGGKEFPVPSAQVWKGVAEVISKGVEYLPDGALTAMEIAAVLGIFMAILDAKLPRVARFLPSATGIGIAGAVPPNNSIAMAVGALIAWGVMKRKASHHEDYTIPIASGLLAGEPLMAAAVVLSLKMPEMIGKIWTSLHG